MGSFIIRLPHFKSHLKFLISFMAWSLEFLIWIEREVDSSMKCAKRQQTGEQIQQVTEGRKETSIKTLLLCHNMVIKWSAGTARTQRLSSWIIRITSYDNDKNELMEANLRPSASRDPQRHRDEPDCFATKQTLSDFSRSASKHILKEEPSWKTFRDKCFTS